MSKSSMTKVQALVIAGLTIIWTMLGVQTLSAEEVTKVNKPTKTGTVLVHEYYYDLTPNVQVELIFHNTDFKIVQIKNSGDPIIASLFAEDYQIGKNDVVSIDPPNVDHFILELQPYVLQTAHKDLMATAHIRTFHVVVPNQKNQTVLQSVDHKKLTPDNKNGKKKQ